MRELNELRTNPPEGIRVITSEDNMLDVTGIVQGPGVFSLSTLREIISAHLNTCVTRFLGF